MAKQARYNNPDEKKMEAISFLVWAKSFRMIFMITKRVGNYLFFFDQILYIFHGDGNDLVSDEEIKERAWSGKSLCNGGHGRDRVSMVKGVQDLDSRDRNSSLCVASGEFYDLGKISIPLNHSFSSDNVRASLESCLLASG